MRWTNGINVSASGNTLQKTGGCGGCADAGASSEQRISSDGGVFVTVTDTAPLRFVGLTWGEPTHQPTHIKFALRLQGGVAEVREAGVYRADIQISAGDVLGVGVTGGTVQYTKNGTVFYASSSEVRYPLAVDAVIYDLNATISNAVLMVTASRGQVSAATATPAAKPTAVLQGSRSAAAQIGRELARRRNKIKSGS